MGTCRFLGNSCVEIIGKEDHVIIDPVFLTDPKPGIEHVFISHHHSDHVDLEKLSDTTQNYSHVNKNINIYSPPYLKTEINVDFTAIKEGSKIYLTNGYIEVFANDCWKAEHCVAYLISIDNVTILHTADSALFSDQLLSLKNQIDFCFIACFQSNFVDYLNFLESISPKLTIPYHFNASKKDDPRKLADFLNRNEIQARYMDIGDAFSF